MRLDFLNRNLFNLSFGQSHNFGDILNRLNSVKNAAFLILSIFVLNLSFIEITSAQTTCTGNVPIQNLANGMNYTITVGPTSGNVSISVTVVDNPPGLVGFLGGPGNPISFPNGSGTFTYNLTGQPNPYVLNMYFNWAAGGQGSSTPVSCSSTVSTPLALPIVFDNQPATLTPFGSNMSATIGVDPTDPTNAVLCATKLPGADCWAGVTVGSPICLAAPIDFASGTTITMDVYSPVAGAPILLKLENCITPAISTEIVVLTTVANAWETLTFNFGTSGCAAPPNLANTYDKLSVFPNFTCTPTACGVPNPGVGSTFSTSAFYFDNIELVPTPIALELPIVFDSQPATLTPFGSNMSATIGVDPTDPTNAVLCTTKLPGADCWAGVTVGSPICLASPIDFASGTTITMDVYSPVAGAPILLKLENCITPGISTEIVVLTTVANAWETLTFNFGTSGCPLPPNAANTYDKLSIFPNFTCTPTACGVPNPGAGSTFSSSAFYFDNIELALTPSPLELPIVFDNQPATLTPFGSNMSATIGVDPTDPTNAVLCTTKLPGADCWAGVTVGSPICLASPIDFASGTTITMDVYSPVAGAPILLKLENCTNAAISTEIVVLTTVANAWETLTFNFGTSGCPLPPNPANTYNKLSVFPNFTCTPTACGVPNPGASSTFVAAPFYFDNIQLKIPQCSGSGAITGLGAPQVPNGYTYTIVENGSGNTTISITVIDNPVGLVGFLGGPGGIMAIANATGTLTWTVASNTLTNPINVFFAWAGNNGSAVPIPYIAGDCLCTATVAAPIPTCAPANVISMFSNTYPNVPVNTWRTPWSAATLTDIQIAGNDTKLYTNLDFVGIETVGPNLMNLTSMTYMHIDVWTPNMTTIRVKLVDFGPNRNFAGGDDSEHEVVLNCSVQCGWNSFHIPLSGFANLRSRAQIAQLILSGLPTGQGTLYVDNVYFTTCAPTAGMKVPATISITETSGLLNNDGIICAGATATLTASGGGTYAWSTGATTTAITTSTAGTYTVTVTNAGCAFSVSQFITVIPLPVASIARVETSGITANDGIICQGAMATLTASGGGTYVWSNGATTAGITTGTAGTYSVTVTSVNGCTATTSSSITVLPLPTPSISVSETSGTVANDGTIYTGSSANLTASGGGTYLWNTGAITAGITVTPSTTTTYTVTVTNANNCSATASTTITVIDPSCLLVCSGDQTITLTNGACEYQLPNLVTGAGVCDFFTIEQVSGPEPGDLLPRGSYDITYQLVSNLGEIIDECTFTVVVRANPVVVNSLTCNDHINISADINCEVTLSPDMFLEGNSYSCYADYQINIWPFNSQANAINNVPQNEGINLPTGEHTYEIVGPSGNRCWGTFTIEDKLAPVVECNCSGPVADVSAFREIGVFGNKKYYLSNATYTWQQAYAHAQSVGGEMLCITSAAENAFILNTWSIPGFASQRTWLGATDNEAYGGTEANNTNNGWVWVSGEPFSYTNWASGEPNGLANEDYVEMFGTGGTKPGRWNDNTNTFGPLRYIMEVENCSYNCYDLAVIQNETVPMLYGVSPNKSVLTTPPTATDGCGPVSATFTDAINGGDQCDTRELVRSWTFEDASGNKSYCTQRFAFEPISVTDLIPPVREVHLTCGLDATPAAIAGYLDVDSRTQPASATNIGAYADDYAQTGSVVEFNEGYSYGYFTYQLPGYAAPAGQPNLHSQKVDNNVCNLYTTYTDDVIPACGIGCSGNMKVIRNWKLLDWCTGEVFTYTQVIKATDEKAPTFTVKNATVGVDPWGCAANWNVGQPWELADNCAKAEEIKWGVKVPAGVTLSGTFPNYRITGLTKGVHTITYWASDCCGNVSEKTATVTVIDASAPVAVAKQNIVMSLTGSGTGADGAGKIYGWQIDNGSYDHCSDVRFEVRRVDGGSCGNVGANGTHNNNSTYNDNNGYPSEVPGAVWFHPQDNAQDTDGGEFVKFCCEDIPAGADYGLHDVELRVWDDGNMNGVIGDNDIINGMKDNYNTTWVTIRVENKLPPALVCPPDVTITCDMELNLSLDAETNVNDVNLTMTGYPQAYDLCSNLQVTYKDQWVGSHDPVCKSGTVRRTFKVTKGAVVVTCAQFITVATLTAPFTVTFPNQNQTTEWDKCSFTLDDARDAANASIKRPIVNYGQCDIVGENITIDTFLFEDGACKKWRVKYSYKNWCTGEEINTIAGLPIVHWYAFKDVTAPVLSCTNQMFAANPNPQNPNGGCEAAVALEASASDKLICAEESWIKWQMFFDGWNDGTVDRLGSSFVNKSWNGIWVPQAKFISGVLNPTWVALQNQHPNLPLADLVYVTYIKPTAASGGTAKLPVGTGATAFILNAENISHKVTWKVTDGCGNVDQCESTVMVVDKKAPTPYCVSVSTALMQTNPQMVELWARDFDKGAFDNCTPQSKLYFTFDGAAPIYSRVNEEHFYKVVGGVSVNATQAEYLQGKAYKWLPSSRSAGFVWTTAGDFNVQVSVWDEAWNTDYCTVIVSVRGGTGSTPSSRVSGSVATVTGQGVNDVKVTFDANMSEYPKTVQTLVNGTFGEEHPNGFNYTVTAAKGGDYLNGVSTLDLVMIQRHILGLQALDSNYKMIAADANKDGKVTTSDLTDLRKLILGVTTTLPNNTSWRFAVAGTPVQTSPIAFTEAINITNLSSEMANQNFVAVKIGDVNGNVSTSVNSPEVESRSNANVEMSVAEALIAAGEVVEIPVTVANFSEVSGFQYTMNLNGASFVGVQSGVLEVNANNVGVISDNVVTMSYASTEAINANEGAVLFTLTVKAGKAMKVSEMISLNSEVTRAESYNSDLKVGKVSLGVRTAPVAGIELFQNEPNPFKGMTTVSFEMPEAATATLSVYDVTGKVVTVRNINAIKGLNSEIFTKDQLGVSGVLYYTLVSGDFTATKKMIIIE